MFREMADLIQKKCKLGGYIRGQMTKNAKVICEGSLTDLQGVSFTRSLEYFDPFKVLIGF